MKQPESTGSAGTILVAADDEALREMLPAMLQNVRVQPLLAGKCARAVSRPSAQNS